MVASAIRQICRVEGSTYQYGFLPYLCSIFSFFLFLSFSLFFSSFSFMTAPIAYGSSQARGQIRAAVVSLPYSHSHSHSHTRSNPHLQPTLQLLATPDVLTPWVGPGIEPASLWTLVGFLIHWTTTGMPPLYLFYVVFFPFFLVNLLPQHIITSSFFWHTEAF